MQNTLEKIKKILDSDAGLINNKEKVVDNRFKLIKQNISLIENKDDDFYSELISLISNYIDKLYDSKIDDFPIVVFDENGERISQEYDTLDSRDMYNLKDANRELSESLFNYVCEILKANKNVKLDIETLKRILNRNPKLFTLSVEQDYLYRTFDYEKLVKIIKSNKTLKKSSINMDEVYQLLKYILENLLHQHHQCAKHFLFRNIFLLFLHTFLLMVHRIYKIYTIIEIA